MLLSLSLLCLSKKRPIVTIKKTSDSFFVVCCSLCTSPLRASLPHPDRFKKITSPRPRNHRSLPQRRTPPRHRTSAPHGAAPFLASPACRCGITGSPHNTATSLTAPPHLYSSRRRRCRRHRAPPVSRTWYLHYI